MLKLVIANKNYSSWSMRPWVLLTYYNLPFEEIPVWLGEADSATQIARYSPSGTVPVLIDGELVVWDSLAICETLAEKYPALPLWPADPAARARARAVSAEMHAGFSALRTHMPMNIRNRYPGCGRTPEVLADITRIARSFEDCLSRSNGPCLFGDFGIADAMYVPVLFRFETYDVALEGRAETYRRHLLATPALQRLAALATAEGHPQVRYDSKYA